MKRLSDASSSHGSGTKRNNVVDLTVHIDAENDDYTEEEEEVVEMATLRWPTSARVDAATWEWLLEVFSPRRLAHIFESRYGGNALSLDLKTGFDCMAWADRADCLR